MTVLFTRARTSAALAVVCALGLTGCSGSAEGSGTPTPSAAASQPDATRTATPSPTAAYKPASADGPAENVPVPKMPAAAKEKSKAGLKAFARYWYALLSYAYESGDLGPLQDASGPECAGCKRVGSTISEWHSSGKWLGGGKLTVVGSVIEQFKPDSNGTYQLLNQVDQEPIFFYLSDGTLKQQTKNDTGIVDVMNVRYDAGRWSADNVEGMG